MAINIKNERVCELAREAARRTGQPQVSAIEAALIRYLEELTANEGGDRDRVDEILAEIDAVMTPRMRQDMQRTMDSLYDEKGLPA